MNFINFNKAVRSLFKRKRNNAAKIMSLATGLAMGLVLIAKVYFEQTYDNFYPDHERIYRLGEVIERDGELGEHSSVSGGVAVGMKEEVPGVELATRATWIGGDAKIYTEDKKCYKADVIAADTCFFDVLPRRMIAGDIKEALRHRGQVIVSKEFADKLGGDVLGKTISSDDIGGGLTFTIGGIFETVPLNTHFRYDIIASLELMRHPNFDGTMNWLGNDRYLGYVKLQKGVEPESLKEAMHTMQAKHQDLEALEKAGVGLSYTLKPLEKMHNGAPETVRTVRMLALLAFVIISTAVMNYVLIVISSLVGRTKEVAVHKCYGASRQNIYGLIMSETAVHLIVSLAAAVFLTLLFRETIEEILGSPLKSLFTWRSVAMAAGVCAMAMAAAGLLPGNIFARIPVAAAFRNFGENRRRWKLALLSCQFAAVGFLVSLLSVIAQQYRFMVNDNVGYNYKNLAYSDMSGADSTTRAKFADEIRALPEVEGVTTFSTLPFNRQSGNNVFLPGDERELFNIADLYFVGDGYHRLMEIPLVAGGTFTENVSSSDEVMVSRRFLEKMEHFADWPDGPVGKEITITEHGKRTYKICGVYEDFRLGTLEHEDLRPSVMFYADGRWQMDKYLLIKFHRLDAGGMARVRETLQRLLPGKEIDVVSWQFEMAGKYNGQRLFRNAVLAGGLIALIIALAGLAGYTSDEMNRRRKEIAIRKVNGASAIEVLQLFEKGIMQMALPALAVGCGAAAFVAARWQTAFSEKVPLPWPLFATAGLLMLALVAAVVAAITRQAANANPVDSIKNE